MGQSVGQVAVAADPESGALSYSKVSKAEGLSFLLGLLPIAGLSGVYPPLCCRTSANIYTSSNGVLMLGLKPQFLVLDWKRQHSARWFFGHA